jgi:hypothetical protein
MRYTLIFAHEAPEDIHLVLHERDERRNHYGRTLKDEGRKLITQRLAPAGRHKHKGITSVQEMIYNLFLIAFELVVPEKFFEGLMCFS